MYSYHSFSGFNSWLTDQVSSQNRNISGKERHQKLKQDAVSLQHMCVISDCIINTNHFIFYPSQWSPDLNVERARTGVKCFSGL